ncbi:hypothetical protein AAII07_46145 [Microvirga sp. 0TCS3.31]
MIENPFPPGDADRHAIWEMLVKRDIHAFVAGDWDAHFAPEIFFGIDGRLSDNPNTWRATFADLARYREAWLAGSAELAGRIDPKDLEKALFSLTTLHEIEIVNDFAMARKKFDGAIPLAGTEPALLRWQTLYFCRRIANRWRIMGFLGYLPNPMGGAVSA